jgi:hypothetical protein
MNANSKPSFVMPVVAALMMLTPFVTATPVGAQAQKPEDKTVIDPDTTPEAKALDRRFREILNRTPDSKNENDPWGSVRAAESTSKAKPKDDKKNSAAGVK